MALLVNKVASDHNELRRLLGHQGQQRFAVLAVFVAVKVGDLHDAQALKAVRQACTPTWVTVTWMPHSCHCRKHQPTASKIRSAATHRRGWRRF